MQEDFVLLTEKEEMWAKMLTEVLENEEIPYAAIPVYGSGVVVRTGKREHLKIYVPASQKNRAEDLEQQLFGEDE